MTFDRAVHLIMLVLSLTVLIALVATEGSVLAAIAAIISLGIAGSLVIEDWFL